LNGERAISTSTGRSHPREAWPNSSRRQVWPNPAS
jgi:hypothetical protein